MKQKDIFSGIYIFRGSNAYLSNFYNAPVSYRGISYKNNEAAFQAQKTLDNSERQKFAEVNPSEAKKMGRAANLRKDWESVKCDEMYGVVKAKFTQNPWLAKLLLHTGDVQLTEGNTWHDTFWGVDMKTGKGRNELGNILMRVREELRE